jgi:hypothetical protein
MSSRPESGGRAAPPRTGTGTTDHTDSRLVETPADPAPDQLSWADASGNANLRESRLVDLGYLDHANLASTYEEALTSARIPSTLCDAISLEVGLASLQTGGCAS